MSTIQTEPDVGAALDAVVLAVVVDSAAAAAADCSVVPATAEEETLALGPNHNQDPPNLPDPPSRPSRNQSPSQLIFVSISRHCPLVVAFDAIHPETIVYDM